MKKIILSILATALCGSVLAQPQAPDASLKIANEVGQAAGYLLACGASATYVGGLSGSVFADLELVGNKEATNAFTRGMSEGQKVNATKEFCAAVAATFPDADFSKQARHD
ncbi:MAG: hypothetical protein ABIK25_07350 [Pseudomonadota bacterium]